MIKIPPFGSQRNKYSISSSVSYSGTIVFLINNVEIAKLDTIFELLNKERFVIIRSRIIYGCRRGKSCFCRMLKIKAQIRLRIRAVRSALLIFTFVHLTSYSS